jgi:hypothetical protein
MHDGLALLIRARWRDRPLAARVYTRSDAAVWLGQGAGWRWSLLGVGLGWVPAGMAPWLRTSPPGLSTVEPAPRGDFLVPTGALSDPVRPVWHRFPGGCLVDVEPGWRAAVRRGDAALLIGPWPALVELTVGDELGFEVGGIQFCSRLTSWDVAQVPQKVW